MLNVPNCPQCGCTQLPGGDGVWWNHYKLRWQCSQCGKTWEQTPSAHEYREPVGSEHNPDPYSDWNN